MQTVSMMRRPSSRATIAAGTRPPRVMATTAWNGPTSLSRQVSARQSRWNWSQDTGNAFSELSAMVPSSRLEKISRLPRRMQRRQHFLHRAHRGAELVRIARADHEVGVGPLVLVQEGIAADDGVGMGIGDLPQ